MSVAREVALLRGRALGTDLVLATTDGEALAPGQELVDAEIAAIDRACSRFRPDSEIWMLEAAGGEPRRVSPMLYEAVTVALGVAEATGGAVDPTVGNALVSLGYDRDFADLLPECAGEQLSPSPALGWWSVELDPVRSSVRVPAGLLLDLGATAKALAADRAAAAVAGALGCGVLVSLGGDVAVAGEAPDGGWPVGISMRSGDPAAALRQRIAVRAGGIASSSPYVRSWRRGGRLLHHIVNPATGEPAAAHWRLVSVAAPTCVEANAATTASIVWGEEAVDRLVGLGLPARLERHDGAVARVGGWPADDDDDDRSSARHRPRLKRARATR